MAYTTNELIAGAYYASGVASREFETVSGQEISDGLLWLNNIITEKTVDDGMVSYETTYTLTAVPGQEVYYIPNLISIDTLVFYLNSVRYGMRYEKRNNYFGSPRVNQIQSLPFQWYFERQFGGGNLYIYFSPDQAYPLEIHGVFRMPEVALGQDLTSNTTTANLGIPTVSGTGNFTGGELVVNGIDLAGTYATAANLVSYINTGVIPGVIASIPITELLLTSNVNPVPVPIYVKTLGTEGTVNNLTFSKFSTINGPHTQFYEPSGWDQFFITYLRYALAERICSEYNLVVPMGVTKELDKYQAWINKKSKLLDLRLKKSSSLGRYDSTYSWQWINLGVGWTPY